MQPFYEAYGKHPKRELVVFFSLTFLITWGLGLLYVLVPNIGAIVGSPPGQSEFNNWLYYLAVYGPTLSALLCVGVFEGRSGYVRLARAVLAPGTVPRWLFWLLVSFAILPLGWLLIVAIGQVVGLTWMGSANATVLFGTLPIALLTTTFLLTDPGPLGEELGWRGFAMPRLLRLLSPIKAGLLLGAIWAVWHIPSFLLSGTSQSSLNFVQFVLSLSSQGVLMCWLYLRTGGNWFFAGFIPHAVVNGGAFLNGFSVDRWVYPLSPLFLAILIASFDPIMRKRIGVDQLG